MKTYILEVKFEGEKDCSQCPLAGDVYDTCYVSFSTIVCPLEEKQKDSMNLLEVEKFIKLAESKISNKDREDKKRQESYVRGLKVMFNMMKDVR